jgi:hypothetical protein
MELKNNVLRTKHSLEVFSWMYRLQILPFVFAHFVIILIKICKKERHKSYKVLAKTFKFSAFVKQW